MESTARRYLALRTGVTAAAAGVAASFERGLLPRSPTDQAMLSGAVAAYWLGSATVGVSAVEAVAELLVRARGHGDADSATLAGAGVLAAGSALALAAMPLHPETPLPLATVRSGAWIAGGSAVATILVIGSDKALRGLTERSLPVVNILTAAALGGTISAVRIRRRQRRGRGTAPTAPTIFIPRRNRAVTLGAVGQGAAVGGGLVALAAVEFLLAEGTTKAVSAALGRRDRPVTPLVGHAVAGAVFGGVAARAMNTLRKRITHTDEVVEPAYPHPPTNPAVTAGPNSIVGFDAIGKEGRRFVLMALSPAEITAVMGEAAVQPVRAIAGYTSAKDLNTRAQLAVAELERLGGLERSLIVVAAPTGVGYVNYSFAEAVEYFTRGDCAIVVPQYAQVPSALALDRTAAGVRLQSMVITGIREKIARLPADQRPQMVQFGESLGAEVALDVAEGGTSRFDELGLDGGLYLGTPFRCKLWQRWTAHPTALDPGKILGQVSQADEIGDLPPSVRHVQVIHHDDPINKFDFASVVRPPSWMGDPASRPPGVPRESSFRPVITFIISLVDLKNGMNSKPGEFVRIGHDYRIELREAVQRAFHLPATPEQEAAIETALRAREQEWAARRMVARRFANARSSVMAQMTKWGVDPNSLSLDSAMASDLVKGLFDSRPHDRQHPAQSEISTTTA
ncbi:MAG: alpha/beta-hydrolase family protein [Candidatus Nanopelagicales bacterium]